MTDGRLSEFSRRTLRDVPTGPIRDRLFESINLMENYVRGWVAEVIVAEALGATMVGEGYGDWDLDYEGKRIEVKSSGHFQAWPQREISPTKFGIRPSQGYSIGDGGQFQLYSARIRRSDAYVFCIHRGVRPDVPSEWTFYVVPTRTIDDLCGDQQTITRSSIEHKLGAKATTITELRCAVDSALTD